MKIYNQFHKIMKSGRLPKVMKKAGLVMSKNDITGDNIKSRITNKAYSDGWSMIFEKPKARKVTPVHAVTRVEEDKTKKIPRKNKYKYIDTEV